MAVRDLLWACPMCRTPGSIRPHRRRERCRSCGAAFRRGSGARIIVEHRAATQELAAVDWLERLGPVVASGPDAEGHVLGPEPVRVKLTRHQRPVRFGGQLLGWVEVYGKSRDGMLSLDINGLSFASGARASGAAGGAAGGAAVGGTAVGGPDASGVLRWRIGDLTGIQPASSTLQLRFRDFMAAVKFPEGSVRLWTRAVSDRIHDHYARHGLDVVELQPHVRTRRAGTNT